MADNDKPDPSGDPEPAGGSGAGQPSQTPQGDGTDWKAEARKWEKRAKDNSDAAARLKELEDRDKSEVERLTQRAAEADRRAQEAETKAVRAEVAAAKGVPVSLLSGSTKEEIEERADQLLQFKGDADGEKPTGDGEGEKPTPAERTPKEQLRSGEAPAATPADDPDAIAKRVLDRGF